MAAVVGAVVAAVEAVVGAVAARRLLAQSRLGALVVVAVRERHRVLVGADHEDGVPLASLGAVHLRGEGGGGVVTGGRGPGAPRSSSAVCTVESVNAASFSFLAGSAVSSPRACSSTNAFRAASRSLLGSRATTIAVDDGARGVPRLAPYPPGVP